MISGGQRAMLLPPGARTIRPYSSQRRWQNTPTALSPKAWRVCLRVANS
jgi:hypothetical protein